MVSQQKPYFSITVFETQSLATEEFHTDEKLSSLRIPRVGTVTEEGLKCRLCTWCKRRDCSSDTRPCRLPWAALGTDNLQSKSTHHQIVWFSEDYKMHHPVTSTEFLPKCTTKMSKIFTKIFARSFEVKNKDMLTYAQIFRKLEWSQKVCGNFKKRS